MAGSLDSVETSNPMFGPLSDGELQMPISSNDGRVLTWNKTIASLAGKVCNEPHDEDDCWFVEANHSSTGNTKDKRDHMTKLSKNGSKNKWSSHRILYLILHPDKHAILNDRSENKRLCLHVCGHGKAVTSNGCLCINPYHIKLGDAKQNRHDERCGHSCRALCPHDPKCVFTWRDTGHAKNA